MSDFANIIQIARDYEHEDEEDLVNEESEEKREEEEDEITAGGETMDLEEEIDLHLSAFSVWFYFSFFFLLFVL